MGSATVAEELSDEPYCFGSRRSVRYRGYNIHRYVEAETSVPSVGIGDGRSQWHTRLPGTVTIFGSRFFRAMFERGYGIFHRG